MQEVSLIDDFVDLLLKANSASDLCRKLTHSNLTSARTFGAALFAIDQQARLQLVGSYGKGTSYSGLSIWDEHPLSESVKSGRYLTSKLRGLDGAEIGIGCLPLTKESEPIGVLSLFSPIGTSQELATSTALPVISKVMGMWLDAVSLIPAKSAPVVSDANGPESLTERQLTVLRLMAEGKTNAQIAQELILSESTIRQETVKIYRALGVHARNEAGKRAKHLGIIDRVAI
jgi:DNA-binding CsgD family transcriptional regulator